MEGVARRLFRKSQFKSNTICANGVREIFRILEETEKEYKPEWLIYENVKGMLSASRGLDFLSILAEMDRLGYDAEWQIVNSRWYVPQNRERVYVIGHNRRRRRSTIFPITGNG